MYCECNEFNGVHVYTRIPKALVNYWGTIPRGYALLPWTLLS